MLITIDGCIITDVKWIIYMKVSFSKQAITAMWNDSLMKKYSFSGGVSVGERVHTCCD